MKLILFVLLLIALPGAYAGTPDDLLGVVERSEKEWETNVRALLDSSEPRLQAWGAWHVAKRRINNLQTLVLEKFNAGLQAESPDARWVQAFTDALIQTRATVPEKNLTRLHELGYPTQTLILVSFTPEIRKEILLVLAKNTNGPSAQSAAASSLLAKHHPLDFANWSLSIMAPRIKIYVIDPIKEDEEPKLPGSFGMRNGGGRRLPAKAEKEEAWPPAVKHQVFVDPAENGDHVLVSFYGEFYFRRTVPSEETLAVERAQLNTGINTNVHRLSLLMYLCGARSSNERYLYDETFYEWKSNAEFLEMTQSTYRAMQTRWDGLIERLKFHVGPIDSKVSIKVEILDLREVKKTPLPTFDEKKLPPLELKDVDVP
jgi:hypothetical protein